MSRDAVTQPAAFGIVYKPPGTVRPVKYTIVANDQGWSKNEMIHLTSK
ncbi:hypothetical protein CRE_08493 [Caenorhabditis remanei]|uniref:Uncharacterized protein n=1 Tax=Caenorhabditis remanei TaxID=31234 RepID=E3N6X3_CAERE|nr:hypothetical protein CRE_08493 [Caenorhabditis remanei]